MLKDFFLARFCIEQNAHGEIEMQSTVVSSWNDFDPLKHAIVGRADFTCIPPSEPATEAKVPEDSDMRGMWGPRPLATVERANAQLDNLVNLLESRGVRVDRPEPIQWNQWPKQYGWWLSRRAKVLEALAQASGDA